MNTIRIPHLLKIAPAAALAFACTQETVLIERTGASIGPEGGSLKSADGNTTLVIPQGALSTTTEITLDVVDDAGRNGLVSRIYDFGPDGLAFDKAVSIGVAVDNASGDVVLAWADPAQAVPLDNQRREGGVILADLVHFSGYGCFNSNAACMSDSDCLMGQVCDPTTATCTSNTNPNGCMTNADCAPSQICVNAQCTGNNTPNACMSDADCATNEQCVNGACTPNTTNPNGCMSDSDCAMGEVCDPTTATCVPNTTNPNGCMSDSDCAMGEVCNPMTATCISNTGNGCTSNADCAPSQSCVMGQCTGGNTPNACMSDADCAMGEVCDATTSTCVPGTSNPNGCMSNADCSTNEVCVNGVCQSNGNGTVCMSDADCPPSQSCNPMTNLCQ